MNRRFETRIGTTSLSRDPGQFRALSSTRSRCRSCEGRTKKTDRPICGYVGCRGSPQAQSATRFVRACVLSCFALWFACGSLIHLLVCRLIRSCGRTRRNGYTSSQAGTEQQDGPRIPKSSGILDSTRRERDRLSLSGVGADLSRKWEYISNLHWNVLCKRKANELVVSRKGAGENAWKSICFLQMHGGSWWCGCCV